MTERGKSLFAILSVGSNATVKSTPGTLYSIHGSTTALVRAENSTDLGASPNLNAAGADTLGIFPPPIRFPRGIGFTALTVASGSNTLTIEYE